MTGLGSSLRLPANGGSGSFKYDTLGNIRQKKLGARTVNMSYDSKMRMTSYTDTAGPNKSLSYDNRGNVTALGALNMGYDYSDQPTSVSGSASGIYKYDGNMKRVKSVVGGKTTYSVYDASGTLVHIDNTTTNKKTDYVAGGGMSLARITNNVVTYLHNDHLGSLGVGTNASGTSLWAERYTPFGETLINNTANDNQAGYTGHIKDSATGLNYMQARYYDPVIGRFLSIDPVGFSAASTGSFNRFSYTMNNPINATDPNGMCDTSRMCRSSGGIATGSGTFGRQSSKGSGGSGSTQATPASHQTSSGSRSSGGKGQSMSPTTACDMQMHCYAPDPAAQPDGSIHVGLTAGAATVYSKGGIVNLPAGGAVGSHVGLVTLIAHDESSPGPLLITPSSIRGYAKDFGEYAASIAIPGPGATIKISANGKPYGGPYHIALGTYAHVQVPDHTPLRFSFAVEGNQITTGAIVHRGYYVRGP